MAASAHVLVGIHGSQLTNAFFMRSGSALIEILPYGFLHWAPITFRRHLQESQETGGHGVYSFYIHNHKPTSFRPGPMEERGVGNPSVYPRDRHVFLDVDGLRRAIKAYVKIDSPQAYMELFKAGGADIHVGPRPLISEGTQARVSTALERVIRSVRRFFVRIWRPTARRPLVS